MAQGARPTSSNRRARAGSGRSASTPASAWCGSDEFEIPTDPRGRLWVHFTKHEPRALHPGMDGPRGRLRSRHRRRADRARRHQRPRPARHPRHPARRRDSGRRDPRPGDRADPVRRFPQAAGFRRRHGAGVHAGARPDRDRAAAYDGRDHQLRRGRPGHAAGVRRIVAVVRCVRLVVRSRPAVAHGAAGVRHRGGHLVHAIRGRAAAGARRLQAIPRAGAGRRAGEASRAAAPRRRAAHHDHHVLRRPRLHHDLRAVQGRSRRA